MPPQISKLLFSLLAASVLAGNLAAPAQAGELARKSIARFNDPLTLPHTRTRCSQMARGDYPWPIRGGWETCVGYATDFQYMENEFYFEVDGPDSVSDLLKEEAQRIGRTCLETAAVAGLAAFAADPSPEPASRAAAGYAAAEIVFPTCIADQISELADGGLAADAFSIQLKEDSGWGKWSNE